MRQLSGIGLGLRWEFVEQLLATERQVDFLEIIPENWLRPRNRVALARCSERWPTVPHSIHLSIGGPDPVDEELMATMREVIRATDAPFFSDHICYSSIGGLQTRELLPLPFSEEAAEHTIARIAEVKRLLDVPLVLENPTYYAVMPGSTMDEATFLRTVIVEGDCGMLLDVNNVYVNSRNHGYDPHTVIDRMPMDRVCQLHLAGYRMNAHLDTLVDTHSRPISDEVWALYRYTLQRAGRLIPTLIEWDDDLPPFEELADHVDLARRHARDALQQPDGVVGTIT